MINYSRDSTVFISIDRTEDGTIIPCGDSIVRHIRKEFYCTQPPARYALDILEDSTSLLQYWNNSAWETLDTLALWTTFFSELDCSFDFPHFFVEDFDEDGYQDLICGLMTNMNGNRWGKIFLFDASAGRLKRVPSAEEDGIWAGPYFNPEDKTIREDQVSGVYGVSYTSIYKLEGHTAVPFRKEEIDNQGLNAFGKGGIKREYIGKNGKWILKKERRH